MKLHRLRVSNLGTIQNADVTFGPGLNVLYGPNDLGKSTLVAAIRLALLLPHASTHCNDYVPWTGIGDPTVDLTFETEPQRIWQVKKVFGTGGSSLLQESRNGRDFDVVARARNVDAKLRQILRWGIAEPGGAGGTRGLPPSFLATALLSTQADVAAMLHESLQADATGSGKERIAAALQAVAQDPLFVAMLRSAQAQKDKAYTDKGAKRAGKDSPFRDAAERLNAARDEKERQQKLVAESQSAEKVLQELTSRRTQKQEALAVAAERRAELERLAVQAADCAAATEQVCAAEQEVARIRRLGSEVEAAEATVAVLVQKLAKAEQALAEAHARQVKAAEALDRAEETARSEGTDPSLNDTLELKLREAAADQSLRSAQQQLDDAGHAQKLIGAAAAAESSHREQQEKTKRARELSSQSAKKEKAANADLQRCDLIQRALDVQTAAGREEEAQANVQREAALRGRLDTLIAERASLALQRAAFTVPAQAELPRMRKLAVDLASSQAALEVGFAVTVSPSAPLNLQVRKDGSKAASTSVTKPVEIEASSEIEIAIGDVATVHVRGGRRQARENAQILADRWNREVAPHLTQAGVADLDGLQAKVAEARELDSTIKAKDTELESLQAQTAALSGAAAALRQASDRANACRAALGDVSIDSLAKDLKKLGLDPVAGLRARRQQASADADAARVAATKAAKELTLADERAGNLEIALNEAVQARDAALMPFQNGVPAALASAQAALNSARIEKQTVASELAALTDAIEQRKQRMDAALAGARKQAERAAIDVSAARDDVEKAKTDRAEEFALLREKRRQRESEDLASAERKLNQTLSRRAALPVPERTVAAGELAAAKGTVASLASELQIIGDDVQRAKGALEQVGGSVARERLRDAMEAFELAERLEKETEADCEAWKLLVEQMKEADAAQASNLGQALAPTIAGHFQALTQKRYQTVRLTPQLGTEGVLVAGAVRDADRMSVGTREQLSTLYRLCLAEYLQTMIVLDDQLVQSDETRMDWFRDLLNEKSRTFQIVVVTCRPGDYLASTSVVPHGTAIHADSGDGFIRAIDLGRALNCSPL